MRPKEELKKELDEKLEKISALRLHKPKKHCGHKEYSGIEDVATVLKIERLEEEVANLRAQIAKEG